MLRASVLFFFVLATFAPALVHAQSASDIQSQIDSHKSQIDSLEAEIAAYQKQLDSISATKGTLQSAINSLTISQKQLAAQIAVTQNKIASANLQIKQLSSSIGDKEASIQSDQDAISKALQELAENDATPVIATIISSDTLGDAWQTADTAVQFNKALGKNISNLEATRTALSNNRDQVAAVKANLVSLANDLTLQAKSIAASKAAQQTLLAQTKNQESTYQQLIATKQAAEKSFEQELNDLQGQLNLIVHPGSLPKVGSGVLSWPATLAFMQSCAARKSVFGNLYCITQYFGNTPFSTANAQVYNGMGHDGLDIGMPIGTPVAAARSGTVLGTGNTDVRAPNGKLCYSFGKWVMVIHGNGLNTLYAHLSNIYVSQGQAVTTGQIVGLSGMTGYATGPHLHFGVYATEGTQIMDLSKFRGGGGTPCTDAGAVLPVATKNAYLNPLSYL